jgi:hypothetical protein
MSTYWISAHLFDVAASQEVTETSEDRQQIPVLDVLEPRMRKRRRGDWGKEERRYETQSTKPDKPRTKNQNQYMETTTTGAEAIHWDLTDLYPSAEALEHDLALADQEAVAFAETYRGRIATLNAKEMAEALRRFDDVQDRMGRGFTYAYLNWSTNTGDATRGALHQKVLEA